jgi:hypothetical protein
MKAHTRDKMVDKNLQTIYNRRRVYISGKTEALSGSGGSHGDDKYRTWSRGLIFS